MELILYRCRNNKWCILCDQTMDVTVRREFCQTAGVHKPVEEKFGSREPIWSVVIPYHGDDLISGSDRPDSINLVVSAANILCYYCGSREYPPIYSPSSPTNRLKTLPTSPYLLVSQSSQTVSCSLLIREISLHLLSFAFWRNRRRDRLHEEKGKIFTMLFIRSYFGS